MSDNGGICFNPSIPEPGAGWSTYEFQASRGYIVKPCLKIEKQKSGSKGL